MAKGALPCTPLLSAPACAPQPQVSRGRETIAPRAAGLGGASRRAAGTELRLQWVLGVRPRRHRPWGVCSPADLGLRSASLKWGGSRLPCLPSCRADCCGRGALCVKAGSSGTGWSPGVTQKPSGLGPRLGNRAPLPAPPVGVPEVPSLGQKRLNPFLLGSRIEPQVWRPGS